MTLLDISRESIKDAISQAIEQNFQFQINSNRRLKQGKYFGEVLDDLYNFSFLPVIRDEKKIMFIFLDCLIDCDYFISDKMTSLTNRFCIGPTDALALANNDKYFTVEIGTNNEIKSLIPKRFSDFNEMQYKEILLGLECGVDITFYENVSFNCFQMEQIRMGLVQNLEVSVYTNPGYDFHQMKEIRKGLESGINVSRYSYEHFSSMQMEQIRMGLEKRLDVSNYICPHFDFHQMEQIRLGLEADIYVGSFAYPHFDHDQMNEIRTGVEEHLNVYAFAHPDFNIEQMREIKQGLREKINITFNQPWISPSQMRIVREGLQKGIDIMSYEPFKFGVFDALLRGIEKNIDLTPYIDYHYSQIDQIRLGLEDRLDVSKFLNMKFNFEQMREIRLGLKMGVDVDPYSDITINWRRMRLFRLCLVNNIENIHFLSTAFNTWQVEQIFLGIEAEIDISKYTKPEFDKETMKQIRLSEMSKKNNHHVNYMNENDLYEYIREEVEENMRIDEYRGDSFYDATDGQCEGESWTSLGRD